MLYPGNISSRFSSNAEANASELLENLEEIILVCYLVKQMTAWNLSSKLHFFQFWEWRGLLSFNLTLCGQDIFMNVSTIIFHDSVRCFLTYIYSSVWIYVFLVSPQHLRGLEVVDIFIILFFVCWGTMFWKLYVNLCVYIYIYI